MSTTQRNWTQVGSKYEPKREEVERVIAGLHWEPVEGRKAMMPALGVQAVIAELNLPRVSRIALNGLIDMPDPPEGTAHYAIYGIECQYSDGKARVYVVDEGSVILPLCSDHFPDAAAELDHDTGQGRR